MATIFDDLVSEPTTAAPSEQPRATIFDDLVKPPTTAGEAAKRGFFNTATFKLYDELKGLARAGGYDPNDPQTDNEIKGLFKGAYRYFTGDKEAEKLYEAEKKRVEAESKRLEEEHPYASLAGGVGGAVALPVAAAARGVGIGARALAAGKTGAVTGGLSGLGAGEGLSGRVAGAAIGAPVGGAVGLAAPYVVEPVVRGAGALAAPVVNRLRGVLDPEAEATRQIGRAASSDAAAGGAGLTGAEFAAEQTAGSPVAVIDRLGQEGLAAARRATNLSPTAHGTLRELAEERYTTTGPRLSDWVRGQFHYPDADAQRIAIAEAARAANPPAYRRAVQEAAQLHPGGLWDEGFEQIAQAPIVQDAIRKASVTGANRAAREGFTPVGNPFMLDRTTGRMTLREDGPRPTLPFWDQVKQNLDKVNTREAQDWARVLRERVDELVPTYGEARAGAATFFGARDMLNAGERFVGAAQKYGIPEARRVLAQASPLERQLFSDGYASRLIQQLEAKGRAARTNMLNQIRDNAPAQEELALGLGGREQAEAFLARLRVEGIMDRLRGALGNSTTARQFIEAGLFTTGGGAAAYDPSSWTGSAGLALALRGGNRFINQRVAQRVAELLASQDQTVVERGIRMVSRNPTLMRALEGADNWTARIAGTEAPQTPLQITVGGTQEMQPSATLFGLGLSQQLDINGDPMSGAKLYVYEANTSTPVVTYTDFALTPGNESTWPIVADSTGRIPAFWLEDGNYRARLTDADDIMQFDEASIAAIGPPISELSTWTPVPTFDTPGNFNPGSFTAQSGQFMRIGNLLHYSFAIICPSISHTTASGNLKVTGLPYAAAAFDRQFLGSCTFEGINLPTASHEQLQALIRSGNNYVLFSTSGSGTFVDQIDAGDVPTGGQLVLLAAGCYRIA